MTAQLRPMTEADADAVLDVMHAAFCDLDRRFGNDPEPRPPDRAPALVRIRHCAQTDPGGAWIAQDDGAVVGAALGIVREGVWGLSLLVVLPEHQSGGLGRALLAASLAHGADARGGIILASEDARALRAYFRAGFTLSPAIDARGAVRERPQMSSEVRPLRWPEDAALVDAVGRFVRTASHSRDIPAWLSSNHELLAHDGGGFAARRGNEVRIVAATDERVATELLQALLAGVPEGMRASVTFISAGQDWAIKVLLDAGLELRPGGAVMLRGEVGPMRPYIPSGSYL